MSRSSLAIAFACVTACGDSSHPAADAPQGTPDAPVADAMPDAPPDAFVDTSLMLRYDFEDSTTVVKDSSSRGMDGTLSDVAAWTANGRNGRGLALSAPNSAPATQFVSLPNGVLTGVSDFTISTWVKTTTSSAWTRIYDFGNGKAVPDNRFMFLTLFGFTPGGAYDGIHASSFSGAANVPELFTGTQTLLPVATWKHVTITGSNGDRHLYIDGFPAGSVTGGATIPPSDMEPLAGNSWLGKSRFGDAGLDGTLDDFRIYDRVLSTSEIADLAWPQHDYSYFRFDETAGLTAKDSSDNAVPAALVNSPTWTTGRLGGAVDLAGSTDNSTGVGPYITLGSSPLASCTTSLTISAWVKLRPATNYNFARVFDFGTGSGTFIYLAATDGGGMHFGMGKDGTPAFDLSASKPIPDDSNWHQAAVTIDPNGLVSLYLDGASVATPTTSATLKPSDYAATTQNWLGRSRFPDPYLNGSIDELRISCRAYTADEITSLSRP